MFAPHVWLGHVCCWVTVAGFLAAGQLTAAQPPASPVTPDADTRTEANDAPETPESSARHDEVPAPAEDESSQEPPEKVTDGKADVTIDLKPTAILEGHDLRATIKVQPDSDNRLLAVMIDAPTFYASTERELEGAASPRTYTFKWDKLPAGMYRVEVVVTDAAGRLTRVRREFQVHGGTLDGEMVPTTPSPGRRRRRQ